MSDFQGLSNAELVRTVCDASDKKGLNLDSVFSALEEALRIAGREKYGNSKIKVTIDKKTGSISILKEIIVIEDSENNRYLYDSQQGVDIVDVYETIKISEAVSKYPNESLEVGSIVFENLPNVDFGRLAVRSARNTILDLIRKLEQDKQYKKYKDRVNDIVIGSVRKVNRGEIVTDLGDAEACLPIKNIIKGEHFRQGDRVKAIIDSVEPDDQNSQIILSRTSTEFIAALFKQEIPEIYDGIIKIHSIAREAGAKSKVAVHSTDRNIDPVGACVGIRSARIKSIIQELNGEKIDVIPYSPHVVEFVINAITPAKAIKAILDEEKHSIELIVEQDQLSLAIGKKGQNVRLASVLVGWSITLLSEGDASKKKLEEFSSSTEILVKALNVEEIIAQLLITEGFTSVKEIAATDTTKLSAVEGFDIDIASELLKRANEYLEKQTQINSDLRSLSILDDSEMLLLHKNGITNLEKLAELSKDDFYDIVKEHNFTEDKVNNMIISAREKLGWVEK